MVRRTKIITEYRQTGGDADGEGNKLVGIGWGWLQNILPCHPLVRVSPVAKKVRFVS